MSLDTVVEDIRDEARARAEEIRADAEAQADELISEAEADAESIQEDREREVEATIEQEREQKLSSAKLEAKQDRLEARRDVLAEVRDAVESEIADLGGDTREELTRTLLDAAVADLGDTADAVVYGRAADQAMLEEILDDYDLEYGGEHECLGGVVVESESSRVRVNNTFDSVIDDVWEDNLREISDRLFGDK